MNDYLNMIINRKHAVQKPPVKKSTLIRYLNECGYKSIEALPDMFVSSSGHIFDVKTYKRLSDKESRNILSNLNTGTDNRERATPKQRTEQTQPQIQYIDGNRGNISAQNLKHATIYPKRTDTDHERLKTAIRCYFEVEKRYNTKDTVQTNIYLRVIVHHRLFFVKHANRSHIDIFKSYIEHGITTNRVNIAKMFNISVTHCRYIINDFINLLANDVLNDLENGLLYIKDYFQKETKTQEIKKVNEWRKTQGFEPLPLRKKSEKQSIREFEKYILEITKNQ